MDIMKQKKENAPPNYAKSTKVPIKKLTYSKLHVGAVKAYRQ